MRYQSIVSAALLVVLLNGCDVAGQLKEGISQSSTAAETIEKKVGTKPSIGFNFYNGSLATVTVQFGEAPKLPLAELEVVTRSAVIEAFKSEPNNLVIAFSFGKKAK